MKKIVLFLLLLVSSIQLFAQCSITATITTQESRCTATGIITISASGGSGTYNYRLNTGSYTSSNVINGLSKGTYTVYVKDVNTGCEIENTVVVEGNYTEPSFELTKEDLTCTGKVGSVNVVNVSGGLAPLEYKLYNSTKEVIIKGNNRDGVSFTGLEPGDYNVQVKDSCGTIRVRQIKVVPYLIDFRYDYKLTGCDSLNVTMIPLPMDGIYIYGAKVNNDTTWSSTPNFSFSLQKSAFVSLLLKDTCGNITQKTFSPPAGFKPHLDDPVLHFRCDSLVIDISSTGFKSNVNYCLWERDTVTRQLTKLVSCSNDRNSTHWVVKYGGYAIVANDGCHTDTATFFHPWMAGGVELNPFNLRCDKFDMLIQAEQFGVNLCLYDSTGKKIKCTDNLDNDPVIKDLPYGRYCTDIFDPCTQQWVPVCSTITRRPVIDISATSYVECSYTQIQLMTHIGMDSSAPYTIWTYDENNVLIDYGTTNTNFYSKYVNANGKPLKIIAENKCGDRDTTLYRNTNPFVVNKSFKVVQKCPGASGNTGGADIEVYATDNHYDVITPTLISKDGSAINRQYDFRGTGSRYYFYDVAPGKYIMRYFLHNCNLEIYDTLTIENYTYPKAVPTSIFKCDNNSYMLKALVQGGVQPYVYEIISSNPTTPSINKTQTNPEFAIDNGTDYSLIRVRSIDACGNSATQDMSVLPLQNIKAYAKDTCFYNTMVLSVSKIEQAVYKWYFVVEGVNTLVSTDSFYQTYFVPEKAGTYLCKISVNDDCIERTVTFNLQGQCYDHLKVDSTRKALGDKEGATTIYPNPSNDAVHILFNKKKAFDYTIEIIGAANGIVYYKDKLRGVSKKDYLIDRKLGKGIYLIKITNSTTGEVQIFKQVVL